VFSWEFGVDCEKFFMVSEPGFIWTADGYAVGGLNILPGS
jgi:hypothetical protein